MDENTHKFPSTRFVGSKAKIIDWIWKNVDDLSFDTVLDAFGGTASFSYLMKVKGKKTFYNDILNFNYNIGLALIENDRLKISTRDFEKALERKEKIKYKKIIQKYFEGLYFTKTENKWLDVVAANIHRFKNKYKKAILISALSQACLIKRPFNLFHRGNLYLRLNNVERTFRNKTLWDAPFESHFKKFVTEFNNAIFSNGHKNKALGGLDIFDLPENFDLVYLDPPYFSKVGGTNYLDYYHFLEGVADYNNWIGKIDFSSKINKLKSVEKTSVWAKKTKIVELFEKMIAKFQESIIVLSYRSDGYPSKNKIIKIIKDHKKKRPIVHSIPYKYVLSNSSTRELLFIAE